MPLLITAPAVPLTDTASIRQLCSSQGVDVRLDDDQNGAVDATEALRLDSAVAIGTERVIGYLISKYEVMQLAVSWTVWNAATVLGGEWLAGTRMNPIPKTLQRWADNILSWLEDVQGGKRYIGDLPLRTTDGIGVMNVVIDPLYRSRQIRTQIRQSDRTPREYPLAMDYFDAMVSEP